LGAGLLDSDSQTTSASSSLSSHHHYQHLWDTASQNTIIFYGAFCRFSIANISHLHGVGVFSPYSGTTVSSGFAFNSVFWDYLLGVVIFLSSQQTRFPHVRVTFLSRHLHYLWSLSVYQVRSIDCTRSTGAISLVRLHGWRSDCMFRGRRSFYQRFHATISTRLFLDVCGFFCARGGRRSHVRRSDVHRHLSLLIPSKSTLTRRAFGTIIIQRISTGHANLKRSFFSEFLPFPFRISRFYTSYCPYNEVSICLFFSTYSCCPFRSPVSTNNIPAGRFVGILSHTGPPLSSVLVRCNIAELY